MSASVFTMPHEGMLMRLEQLVAIARAAEAGSPHWVRFVMHLEQEITAVRAFTPGLASSQGSPTQLAATRAAHRLTQLARIHDGLPLGRLPPGKSEQFVEQRRLVVLAAWQLLRALEQQQAREPVK